MTLATIDKRDLNSDQLTQRVYDISFPDQEQLNEYNKYELAKKRDLFFFHPLSPGSCFFLPHGARICNKLMEFIRNQYRNRGYEEVWTPNMYSMQLWEKSGRVSEKNMFVIHMKGQEFGLKPINWPGHCLLFDYSVRSHAELPLRLADFSVLHQNEPIAALSGLNRLRRFQQDDAHIFCRESQIKDEVKNVLEFISYVYRVFGFNFELKLSTRPEEFYGDVRMWEKAEAALVEALNEFGKPWEVNGRGGAFRGPKIDISFISPSDGSIIQCADVELDFELPARFDLCYWAAEDEI